MYRGSVSEGETRSIPCIMYRKYDIPIYINTFHCDIPQLLIRRVTTCHIIPSHCKACTRCTFLVYETYGGSLFRTRKKWKKMPTYQVAEDKTVFGTICRKPIFRYRKNRYDTLKVYSPIYQQSIFRYIIISIRYPAPPRVHVTPYTPSHCTTCTTCP